MAHKIANAKTLQNKAKGHQVIDNGTNEFTVISGSSGTCYTVTIRPEFDGARCTCDWGQYRPGRYQRSGCSHVQAVYRYAEGQCGRTTSAWTDPETVARQHRHSYGIGDGVILTTRSR